jgi:hypothetical protein
MWWVLLEEVNKGWAQLLSLDEAPEVDSVLSGTITGDNETVKWKVLMVFPDRLTPQLNRINEILDTISRVTNARLPLDLAEMLLEAYRMRNPARRHASKA